MTCYEISTVGCTGLELVAPYRHATISTQVKTSIYTGSDVPYAPFPPQSQGEAPQVVIEASHRSQDSHEFLYPQSTPQIPEQEQILTSATTFGSPSRLDLEPVTSHDFLGLMTLKRKATVIVAAFIASIWGLDKAHDFLNPNSGWKGDEEKEEAAWVASSQSAFDRGACRWIGACGLSHIAEDPPVGSAKSRNRKPKAGTSNILNADSVSENQPTSASGSLPGDSWRFQDSVESGIVLKDVPQYVLDYAPLVHLYSGEQFWPCDASEHLKHTTPNLNYTPISTERPTLHNLDALNELDGGRFVFLKSDDNVEDRPDWLGGAVNIPDVPESHDYGSSWADWDSKIDGPRPNDDREVWEEVGHDSTVTLGGKRPEPDTNNPLVPSGDSEGDKLRHESEDNLQRRRKRDHRNTKRSSEPDTQYTRPGPGGRSSAPAILILVEKSPDIIDAFWFYFYSYNLGNTVLNVRFGNHVGDWEHSLVRFQNGVPRIVFFSEHAGGKAYTYDAVEKIGLRPVIYSAEGTHAMYATPGEHPYILPGGLLKDVTDKGKLWDPALNLHSYHYNYTQDFGSQSHDAEELIFRPTALTPSAPTNWFWFAGHWGDKFYKLSDARQYRFLKEYHYVNGPLGPRFKHLGRRRVCQGNGECVIRESLSEG